jgi:hypothetical protein
MALILRRARMEIVNMFAGGMSTPLSADIRFDDRIISPSGMPTVQGYGVTLS